MAANPLPAKKQPTVGKPLAVFDPDWLDASAEYPWEVKVTGTPYHETHDHDAVQSQTVTFADGRWAVIDSWGGDTYFSTTMEVIDFIAAFFSRIDYVKRLNQDEAAQKQETQERETRDAIVGEIAKHGLEAVVVRCEGCHSICCSRDLDGTPTVVSCSSSCARHLRKQARKGPPKQKNPGQP